MMDLAVINLAEFICESDAIEGIHNNPDLVIWQIATRVKKMKEAGWKNNWGDGHVGALLMLESLARIPVNQYISKQLICDVQALITAEQHKKSGGHKLAWEWIGRYRKIDVSVGGRRCPSSEEVPELMNQLIAGERFIWWQQNARTQSHERNISEIADFHFRFEIIHPFVDGNGRTGRALAYFLLRAHPPHRPFIFTNRDKSETYYRCFDDPRDPHPMEQYFLLKLNES